MGRKDSSPPLGRTPSLEEGARLRPPLPYPYIKGGEGGAAAPPSLGASLPLLHLFLLPLLLGEALLEFCFIHHHAVVLLDLHQPLLSPCWIKKEETSSAPYVC